MTVSEGGLRLEDEQLAYYRARASEYDQWWRRQGRYDRGELLNAQWFADAAAVSAALAEFRPAGRLLELAGGTGIWSEQLLPLSTHLTVVDGSPEMLALNAARLGPAANVRHLQANLFEWNPEGEFDVVFFSFWLSHVPPERFAAFWQMVRSCLAPGGRVFFLDSLHQPASTASDHRLPTPEVTTLHRRLDDGREFQIYKVFYEPADLTQRLTESGWNCRVRQTSRFFLYGEGQWRSDPSA